MSVTGSAKEFHGALERARRSYSASGDIEQVIDDLRGAGLNMIECIKAVMELHGMGPGEAKKTVHFSKAWSDLREAHDAAHVSLTHALTDELGSDS
jgi:ribosomal protein L7/L12